ncbi:uncharacterized protein LOC107424881 [Ziziphus jujuba]|uniref:Uncharacterized protein LOC107424881 n=1 Tax=Ziziphus jujuba TaxID=326968 RepID=A0A6P4A4N9_ZIZJJ|nr:uncharacterized protein LOC107424881 [Ziziphus jujuba]
MVGQWTVNKPSRSDEVVDADQQLKLAEQIRAQFDSITPKRPLKPNRSEPDSSTPTPDQTIQNHTIPELRKFRSLQSQSHVIFSTEGVSTVPDNEFVETQYYRELDSIEKEHHTTGSGFIKIGKEGNEDGYGIQLPQVHSNGEARAVGCFRSNPATNDWVPSTDDDQIFISSKPNRSESS